MPTKRSGPVLEDAKQLINNRLFSGRLFWKPLHDRMDYWMTMYLLLDAVQQLKPSNYRRYISNDPRTAIDAAISILTRNEPFWRIDTPYGMPAEERENVGKIERALAGVVGDFSRMFLERYEGGGSFWNQAAFWAVARGAIWGKFMVTKESGRRAPFLGEFWDPRFVYPNPDGIGMESVVVEKHSNLNELMRQYGSAMAKHFQSGGLNISKIDPNAPACKIEFWSNDRNGEPGFYGVLGYYSTQGTSGYDPIGQGQMGEFWLIEPYYHGYTSDSIPVIGVPVNGIPIRTKPPYGPQVIAAMSTRAQRLGMSIPTWHDPSGWVAEHCRGLLSTIEELQPQYNELVATALQYFSMNAYPTWVFQTQTGEMPDFADGINARVPLRIGETANRLDPRPITPDAYRLMELVREERQRGTLDAVLQAGGGLNAQSGVVLQQYLNAALNKLEPFGTGLTNFGSLFGSHIIEQFRVASTSTLSLVARGNNGSMTRIEFDPKTDLEERTYNPLPIFRPAVPEDLLLKAQVARLLLDPRMPIMSVVTVLDKVFQLDDPAGEDKRMLEDIANRDPVILLERIATIFEEAGEPEIADRIRQKEFQAKMQDKAQEMTLVAQIQQIRQQLGLGGSAQAPEGPGLASTSGSPESTGAGLTGGQGGPPLGGGDLSALGSIGGI